MHIKNLIDLTKVKKRFDQHQEQSISKETIAVINWLFTELRGNFTAFQQAWPTQIEFKAAKRVWIKAFILAGINRIEQLQHGLNHCYLMEKPFVPTAGQFISWCKPKPENIGLPDIDEAYRLSILINRQFSDYNPQCQNAYTVIKHAINQIGSSDYRSMNSQKSRKAFEHYYSISCKQFIDGKLKKIDKAITESPESHPDDKERVNEARVRAMDAIRKMGLKISSKGLN